MSEMLAAEDFYVVAIAALLPLTACMLVSQVNPYHALIIRGILGAVAALVYALFGAADVALTEALVGTMLSITLYAVAVRSSLRMRLGVLEQSPSSTEAPTCSLQFAPLYSALRQLLDGYHMRLELVFYSDPQSLQLALSTKDIHAICVPVTTSFAHDAAVATAAHPTYHLQTRIQRLHDLFKAKLTVPVELTYTNRQSHDSKAATQAAAATTSAPAEGQS